MHVVVSVESFEPFYNNNNNNNCYYYYYYIFISQSYSCVKYYYLNTISRRCLLCLKVFYGRVKTLQSLNVGCNI